MSKSLPHFLGCRVRKLPTTYLGLPLGAIFKSPTVWDVVEERFHKRLGFWKRQYLSKGGRLTLLKSTLCNLTIYFMPFFFIIPKAVHLDWKNSVEFLV